MKLLGFDKVLCIGTHPDDVEYGMLGTIAKHEDTQFDILVLSVGGRYDESSGVTRQESCRKIWKDFDNIKGMFWDQKSTTLTEYGPVSISKEDEWVKNIENLMALGWLDTDYDCIFTQAIEDTHFEHRQVATLAPALARHKRIGVASFAGPSTLDTWIPNLYIEIHLTNKMKYLLEFDCQQNKSYFTESSIRSFHSNYQATKKGINYVESFKIERIYV